MGRLRNGGVTLREGQPPPEYTSPGGTDTADDGPGPVRSSHHRCGGGGLGYVGEGELFEDPPDPWAGSKYARDREPSCRGESSR